MIGWRTRCLQQIVLFDSLKLAVFEADALDHGAGNGGDQGDAFAGFTGPVFKPDIAHHRLLGSFRAFLVANTV